MKICMLAKRLAKHRPGGLEVWVQELSKNLLKLGHDVTAICWSPNKAMSSEIIDGIKVYYVPALTRHEYIDQYLSMPLLIYFLRHYLSKNDFDIIHGHGIISFGYLFAKKLRLVSSKPFVYTLYGLGWKHWASLQSRSPHLVRFQRFTHIMDKECAQKADHVIAISKNTALDAIKEYKVIPNKINVIPGGVDKTNLDNHFTSGEILENMENKQVILFVGSLSEQKGLTYLIKAAKIVLNKFPDTVFLVIGRGKKDPFENIVNQLGIATAFSFLGEKPHNEIRKYYESADIFVLPTLYEGFGLVYTEAMAAGKPIVATKIGPIPEIIIDGKTGLLVKPKAIKDLAKAMIMLLANKDAAKKMGALGKERVKRLFTWEKTAKKTQEVYLYLLKRSLNLLEG